VLCSRRTESRKAADEDEAMDSAIANQGDRRSLNDEKLARLVMVVDKRKQRGGDRKSDEAKSTARNRRAACV
jgi:hypothetical protein